MKVLAVFCFVFCLIASASGQDGAIVKGKVTSGGGAVRGVTVTLSSKIKPDKKSTSVTDTNGEFQVSVSGPGQYLISASITVNGRTQASEQQAPISLTHGNVKFVNLELRDTPVIKESVTVAAGEGQTVEQVSKTVEVISQQEMRDRADFSLIESLRTIPGFRVAQSGGFGRVATIKTRGLRNQDTAILIDGIRFRDAAAITGDASSFLSDFTLTSVARVEVLRGSGSSLYGTNAVGGSEAETAWSRAECGVAETHALGRLIAVGGDIRRFAHVVVQLEVACDARELERLVIDDEREGRCCRRRNNRNRKNCRRRDWRSRRATR